MGPSRVARLCLNFALLVSASLALAQSPTPEASPKVDVALVKLFAKELAPFVKQLNRPISAYHYSRRPRVGLEPRSGDLHHPTAVSYALSKPDFFWKRNLDLHNMAGNGLYLAHDPSLTKDAYGGSDFGLIGIDFPKDTRVLMTSRSASLAVSPTLAAALENVGCSSKSFNLFDLIRSSASNSCQEVFRHALRLLEVRILDYDYQQYGPKGCAPNRHTFVLVDETGLESKHISYLEADLSKASPEQLRLAWMISKLDGEGGEPESHYKGLAQQWRPQLTRFSPSKEDKRSFEEWRKNNIIGCDGNPESAFSPIDADQAVAEPVAVKQVEEMIARLESFNRLGVVAACPDAPQIEIKKATVSGVDRAALVANYCNGLDYCSYEMAYVGSVVDAGKVEVEWICAGGDATKPKSIEVVFDRSKSFVLSCP